MARKFSSNDIENDATMQRFFNKKTGIQPGTKSNYIHALLSFCNFTGKSPTEVFEIHRNDLRESKAEFDQWLNDAFDDYIAYLINSNYAYSTINIHVLNVKAFLHTFKLKPTPTTTISKKNIAEDSKYALDIDDIRLAVKHCSLTYQTLIITQAQTGLSLSDALLLDVEDFISGVSKKNENLTINQALERVKNDKSIIGCFDLRRKKTSVEFYTFAGPEVLKNMAILLRSRDKKHLQPNMPIFMKDASKIPKKLQKTSLNDLRLTREAVQTYMSRLHNPKGKFIFPKITVHGKERNYFRTHKLRKWYSNRLHHDAGFNLEDTKYLMGQKTGDIVEHYINPNNYRSLKNKYRKALPFLAITEEVIVEDNKEAIDTLKKENQKLKEQHKMDSKSKDEEIELLRKEINLTKTLVEGLIKERKLEG